MYFKRDHWIGKNRWIMLGVVGCIAVIAGAYLWVTGLMDSLYAYRSPLHQNPPIAGKPVGKPLTRRVVFVLIDALREDTSLKVEVMPYLNELRQQAAWATMHSQPPSYSDPGYSVLMIGAWPDINDGPVVNLEYEDTPTWTQDNLFTAAHRLGLKTAISGYYWFEKLIPQQAVDASFYTPGEDAAADREVIEAALPWLISGDYQFILIHLDQVDFAGHYEGGPRDPRWDAAAFRSDNLLREITATLDFNQDTLIVLSDHGQINRGGHGGNEPVTLTEPFLLVGAGGKPGHYQDVYQIDIAPTVAALLGMNIPASSQGRPLTELLTLAPNEEIIISDALSTQKYALLDAYQAAIGVHAERQPAPDSTSGFLETMEAARQKRLSAERLPRFTLAFVLVLILTYLLFLKRGKTLAWIFGGAFTYLAIFNLRYAVLDGRTYSLSSVISADDLIQYCAITAMIALIIGWLLGFFGKKLSTHGSRRAAEYTLALTFSILYLHALIILWSYSLNGVIITWALPDFSSMFLGFLSLLQSLMVASVGLVLTALTALIVHFVPHSKEKI
jgi:hypothetical protein